MKVKGALFSHSASGKIGPRVVFSVRESGQQVRIQKAQKDVITDARTTQRTLYQNAVSGWNALTDNEKEVYKDRALYLKMSGYNLYIKENIGATPATVPGAPTDLIATSGNGSVGLVWTAPAFDGGSAITDYVVQYKLSTEPTTWSTFSHSASTTPSITVTGLSGAVEYDFRILATNAVGNSSPSDTDSGFADWYSVNYGYRSKFVIDHTKVPNSDLSYFPVLFSRTDANFKVVASGGHVGKSNGGDILYTSSDGITKLKHEIERYISTTGEIAFWVKVPSLSHTTDTVIYMYYGYASASDQWDINGTWDDNGANNFRAVYHLPDGTTLSVLDSTASGKNGSLVDSPSASSGVIDGCISLDGSNDAVSFGDVGSSDTTQTIEFWVNFSSISSKVRIPLSWGGSSASLWLLNIGLRNASDVGAPSSGDAHMTIRVYDLGAGGSVNNRIYGATNFAVNTWYHVAIVGNASAYKIYVNGVAESLTVGTGLNNGKMVGGLIKAGTAKLAIGTAYYSNAYDFTNFAFSGLLDELRISKSERSADWIKTCYNNQNSPASFYSSVSQEVI